MHFLYPADLLTPRLPDAMFRAEADAMVASGHTISLLDSATFAIKPSDSPRSPAHEACLVYRGWMLTPDEYAALSASAVRKGATLRTGLTPYLATHYLPHWYPLLADRTPETVILDPDAADLIATLRDLQSRGWSRFFVKDFVKSLKTAGGSVIERPEDIARVLAEMRKYRGTIEGGLCVRRFEAFVPNSEFRYFVIDGTAHASEPDAPIPPIVRECAARLRSPFFSVDVATRTDGAPRLIEVGDGQVSDLVGWTVDRFASLWRGK